MPQTPPQTDTYNTALDIFDRTHPLRVDADENLKVVGTFTPSGIQDVHITASVPISVSGTVAANPSFIARTDTFTGPGTGPTMDASTFVAKSYSIGVKGTNAPATSWTVQLEVSLDNVDFTPVMVHTNAIGDGTVLLSGANLYPALYFRARVASVVLGSATNIVVTIVGKG